MHAWEAKIPKDFSAPSWLRGWSLRLITSAKFWTIVFPKRVEIPSDLVKNNLLSSVMHEMMSAMTSEELLNRSDVIVYLSKLINKVGRDDDLRMSCYGSCTFPSLITLSIVARADFN